MKKILLVGFIAGVVADVLFAAAVLVAAWNYSPTAPTGDFSCDGGGWSDQPDSGWENGVEI